MSELFIRILNVGIAGGWIALGVLLLRVLLRKTPRWVLCLLWAMVALRLLVPFTFYSPVSLQPSSQVIPANIETAAEPAINSGITIVNEAVNPLLTEMAQPQQNKLEQLFSLGVKIWLVGMGLILLYSVGSYLYLRYRVRIKVAIQNHVYICDDIASPFILGMAFPKVYLPSVLSAEQQADVLAHEFAHLKRHDHWWKPLSFLLLAVYWFNPLLWVAYILLCRDIEQACDEKVIAEMTPLEKTHYAQTLLQCSVRRYMVAACPVAFGEVSVKRRIKGILSYKHPGFWVIILSFVACAVVAVCFLTDPLPCKHDYSQEVLSAPGCTETGRTKLLCKKCDHSYVRRTTETGHHYEDGEVLTQPTCTSVGVRNRACVDCGHTVTANIEMTTHIPGEYTVTEPSTCSKEGIASTCCTACGITMTASVVINPKAHSLQETVITAATCTEGGEGKYSCQWCTYEEKCTYEELGHEFVLVDQKAASCSQDGYAYYKCTHCEATDTIWYYSSSGHTLNYSGLCTMCGRWFGNSYTNTSGTMCYLCGLRHNPNEHFEDYSKLPVIPVF